MSKSFESAMTYAQAVIADCDIPILNVLQMAHKHEIEQAGKAEYARGYRDGQRSMDAEHRAVAMRLQSLRLDEGSHENLSAIAKAVYQTEWGWTQGACEGLRDELIRLLGGIHDDPVSVVASGDAYGDDCHRHDGEAWRVTYDELSNERHKAVCRLREWSPDEDGMPHRELWEAVMGEKLPTVPLKGDAELDIIMRDRLIHLLGGDEPNFMEIAKTIKLGVECDGKIMEKDENHQIEPTITDELRECVNTATKTYDDTFWHEMGDDSEADHTICHITEGELLRVADGIDAQFKCICEQNEAVLQSTISDLIDKRDELLAKLVEKDAIIARYRGRERSFVESERLQAKLKAVQEALDD